LTTPRVLPPRCDEMIDFVEEKCVPYIIFANKQDLSNTPIYTEYPDVIIIHTEAISGKGVSEGIISLLELMEPEYIRKIKAISC